MDIYFEKVESILSKFPISWQKNYYQNKRSLIIEYKKREIRTTSGCYDHQKNIITIYDKNNDASVHELFHMSFRDEKKVNCEINNGMFYGNGVALVNTIGEKQCLYGLTEGFAEYLSRLTHTTAKGHPLEYFFTDLLISIYGEEILEYPFNNDPLGLMKDTRFYHLSRFTKGLDKLFDCEKGFTLISYLKEDIEHTLQENWEDGRQIIEFIEHNMKNYHQSIVDLFDSVIEEYLINSQNNMKKDLFVQKLSSFLTNSDYKIAFSFDDKEHILKKKIHSYIQLIQ